jgi:uncharacterized membrane protein (TIGR02234 family)
MNGRVALVRAVVVTAVGALLVLLASGREWARTTVAVPAGPRATVTATGHAVEAALPALGIALLALAGAIIAGRGVIRRIVGVVTALAAAAAVAVAIAGRGHVSKTLTGREPGGLGIAVHATANGWWLVAAIGAALALVAGVLTALRGPSWAAMGAKYEAQAADRRPVTPAVDAWDALDRGEDPTR